MLGAALRLSSSTACTSGHPLHPTLCPVLHSALSPSVHATLLSPRPLQLVRSWPQLQRCCVPGGVLWWERRRCFAKVSTLIALCDSSDEIPGIHHITPWAKAAFCYFGEGGNIGKKTQFTKSPDGLSFPPTLCAVVQQPQMPEVASTSSWLGCAVSLEGGGVCEKRVL